MWFLLDQVFPYWFYFASLEGQLLSLLMIVECKHQKTPKGIIISDKHQQAMFLERHFLCNEHRSSISTDLMKA